MSAVRRPVPGGKMAIFQGSGSPSLAEAAMSTGRSHVADEPIEEFFSDAITKDFVGVVPFRQEGPDGFSLVRLDIPPGGILPRHSHSADCLYYVVSGGIVMGKRELGAGDGFFVPSDQPYGYSAGSEGVVLLEFRHSTAFDTKFFERDPARFRAKAEASLAEAADRPQPGHRRQDGGQHP
jgi:quercetin dioxygenase-like cupin family protein